MKSLVAVLFFTFLTVRSSAITLCDGYFNITTDSVTAEYNEYAADLENQVYEVAANYFKGAQTEAEKDSATKKIKSLLFRNRYLEMHIPPLLANKIIHGSDGNAGVLTDSKMTKQNIKDLIISQMLGRRLQLLKLRDTTPVSKVLDFNDTKLVQTRKGQYLTSYTTTPMTYKEMNSYLPYLRDKWAKPATPKDVEEPQVVIFPIKDVPGLYIFISPDARIMNHYFYRMSWYVEVIKKLMRGDAIYGQGSAGHDLQGKDINTYFDFVNSTPEAFVAENPQDKTEQLRMNIEKEFLFEVLAPILKQSDPMVALAVAADLSTVSVLSHEFIHGQFFLNPRLQELATKFWKEQLSEKERNLFKSFDTIKAAYDPNDEFLMINELLAHVTQVKGEAYYRGRDNPLADFIAKYHEQYLKFLVDHGYNLIR